MEWACCQKSVNALPLPALGCWCQQLGSVPYRAVLSYLNTLHTTGVEIQEKKYLFVDIYPMGGILFYRHKHVLTLFLMLMGIVPPAVIVEN